MSENLARWIFIHFLYLPPPALGVVSHCARLPASSLVWGHSANPFTDDMVGYIKDVYDMYCVTINENDIHLLRAATTSYVTAVEASYRKSLQRDI